jgi:glycosyltransferase involved in cell wall biosynthesis
MVLNGGSRMSPRLRIVHVFRAPAGGLFRHVRDLARGQAEMGHEVGIICDAKSGGKAAETVLADHQKFCALGIHRIAIDRLPGLSDLQAAQDVARISAPLGPDILHGHGAKGGVYARLAGGRIGVPSVYTPHGGSLHYEWTSPSGALFLTAERLLVRRGSGLLFVCDFERDRFARKIGLGGLPHRVVHNGLWPEEFAAVTPSSDATDLLFIGELRELKGVGDFIDAVAGLASWRPLTATIVGDGPDRDAFEKQVDRLQLKRQVRFTGQLPARQAFSLGHLLVVPSHAESFPYIVLEAVAAEVPLIATHVGGIPEMLPLDLLAPPRNPAALASLLRARLEGLDRTRENARELAQDFRQRFAAQAMCADVTSFYREAMARSGASG